MTRRTVSRQLGPGRTSLCPAGSGKPGCGTVRTTYFDEPVEVHYRTSTTWQTVLALAVRRCDDDVYSVLIADGDHDDAELALWVPRSLIRADDWDVADGPGTAWMR